MGSHRHWHRRRANHSFGLTQHAPTGVKVQFLASLPHYEDHLRPVYDALPGEVRGVFTADRNQLALGVPTVVCSYRDLINTNNPTIFFEHGSGFRYNVNDPSYSGSKKRDRVILFCNTNQFVAEANEAANPGVRSVIVGCPKMDYLASIPAPDGDTVAFSWHWECFVTQETRSAWKHYKPYLQNLAASSPWTPLGHAHPRMWTYVRSDYSRWGWKQARHFDQVCKEASVYVCDTSSTIYEFAALGRPVVVLNAPWYRKHINHGLRFWDHIPGIQVDDPNHLGAAIEEALTNDTWAEERRRITELVYPNFGKATQAAANAILSVL